MKNIDKVLKSLEKIAKVSNLPKAKDRLVDAKEFMEGIVEREGNFTRYYINTGYSQRGLNFLELEVYFMGEDPSGPRIIEFDQTLVLYGRKRKNRVDSDDA